MSPTNIRNVRVDAQTWALAKAVAAARGETLSDVIRDALTAYVETHVVRTDGTSHPNQPTK